MISPSKVLWEDSMAKSTIVFVTGKAMNRHDTRDSSSKGPRGDLLSRVKCQVLFP